MATLFAPPVTKVLPSAGKDPHRPKVTVAQGRIEIPTDQKRFASAPIEGRAKRILVEHGQPVKRGDVLAEIESIAFKALQLDLTQALARLRQAEVTLDRIRPLGQDDVIAQKELWQLQSDHDKYKQLVDSLRRRLSLVGLSLSQVAAIEDASRADSPPDFTDVLPIRAPADGLVADFKLIPGQVVVAQSQLFELHNAEKVWVQAFLFETDAKHVHAGQVAQVTIAADPSFRARGKIDRLNPTLLEGNRALAIWIEIENPNFELKEGMAAIASIDTAPEGRLAGN